MKQTDQIHQIDQIGQMFWDIDPKKLDIIRHKRFIMERILQYGTPPEISWLLDTYKKKDIIQVVKQSKNINGAHNLSPMIYLKPPQTLKIYFFHSPNRR